MEKVWNSDNEKNTKFLMETHDNWSFKTILTLKQAKKSKSSQLSLKIIQGE